MRILLIVTLLIVGCSETNNSTDGTYTRSAELAKESQEISERERQCIHATVVRSNNQIARIASTSDPTADARSRMQMVANDRDREQAKCRATADREEEELSARERDEYQRKAKDERERNSLMSILTTSLQH
jgi:hypothetical protein